MMNLPSGDRSEFGLRQRILEIVSFFFVAADDVVFRPYHEAGARSVHVLFGEKEQRLVVVIGFDSIVFSVEFLSVKNTIIFNFKVELPNENTSKR